MAILREPLKTKGTFARPAPKAKPSSHPNDESHERQKHRDQSDGTHENPHEINWSGTQSKSENAPTRISDFAPYIDPHGARWWVKVVGMGQQNWAIPLATEHGTTALFVSDTSGVFDRIDFATETELSEALARNGFREFSRSPELQAFLSPPPFPLEPAEHPNGAIYSSGRHWR